MNTKLTADQSATLLTAHLRAHEPFSFWRFGDGAVECLKGMQSQTCDHEVYSVALAQDLTDSIFRLAPLATPPHPLYFGDWLSASFSGPNDRTRYETDYQRIFRSVGAEQWLHFESLLFMRESNALADFYRAVREDTRRKLYMGPWGNAKAADWLGARFLPTPMRDLHATIGHIEHSLMAADFEVLVYGAGMAGVIPVVRTWERYPERTYVSLGSAMDPFFRGKSRQQQLSRDRCWAMVGGRPE